ncbi:S1C family serine protease [Paraliomyxa miuraensis]|uniref:S1C family serine protease n=1 Tax=Paraliomyxa miuraensis TaxID=376150 RepID=UPI002252CDF2|nr:trypsin-like peptidase domain-containing protein [Paraliomyxa miuraensis]MCX4246421.1 trypsin-like peptidase domain-containing protein [Paraliomyxa miuraensis]
MSPLASRWSTLGTAACLLLGCACPLARAAHPPALASGPEPRAARSVSEVYPRVIDSVALVVVSDRGREPRSGRLAGSSAVGSGVLISADGRVMTAAHLVHTADVIEVYFSGGEPVTATVISSDPMADVALLRLARVPAEARPARLADSDQVAVGDEVFVVGAPLGISHTLTVGHLGARRAPEAVSGLSTAELFQTDAVINPGNSGGPMFDMRGEVIGIVSHVLSQSGGFEGLGFAVTANAARELLLERDPFWSGVASVVLEGRMAEIFNLPQAQGLLVQRVARGSPVERLGLRGGDLRATIGQRELLVGGDVILAVQGIEVERGSMARIRERLSRLEPGEPIVLRILRRGEVLELRQRQVDTQAGGGSS